jgi:hypothetical protein
MRLRTGLKAMVGLSALGIAIATLLIFTCPFAGQMAFSTLVRQAHTEHGDVAEHHAQQHHGETQEAHGAEEHHLAHERFTVHLMVIPHVRAYPAEETRLFGIEVAPVGILVLLLVLGLSFFILQQRRLSFVGHTVTPQTMGIAVFLITVWNVVFAAFLLVVEIVQLKEL